ncbi:hypothetical protein PGT21_021923 [Puccinia graminis f. sp. tritici]|uniref:VASt domain-containing protein n=1 Tax=Puccinia graminis f. sp. tritici TaxID=56615 RepID=A0A5B0PY70_PUCGR|nr:hypothetical protein PGT21_021923 [Puccinia graminis f. sp. tritici]
MFMNKLTGRKKTTTPAKSTTTAEQNRLTPAASETYPPPTKQPQAQDQQHYSSLGLIRHNNNNNSNNIEQQFSASPSAIATSFPQNNQLDPQINTTGSRNSNKSNNSFSRPTPAPSSDRPQPPPTPGAQDQLSMSIHSLATPTNQSAISTTKKSILSSSSSSSISSSTDSNDPTSSSLSLSSLTPTNHSIQKHPQQQHPWPESNSDTPTLSTTPTPANHLARIPNRVTPVDHHPSQSDSLLLYNSASSSSSTPAAATPSHLTQQHPSQSTITTLLPSAGLLTVVSPDSNATPLSQPTDDIPVRPRASSYHTSPAIERVPLPRPAPPLPVKRPTSLFSAANPPNLAQLPSSSGPSQPPTPHSSLDSTTTTSSSFPRQVKKSGKRTQNRKPKTESRSLTNNSTSASSSAASTPTPSFGIASALALSGVSLAPHSTPFNLSGNMQSSSTSSSSTGTAVSSIYGHQPFSSSSINHHPRSSPPDLLEKEDRTSVHTTDSRAYNLSALDDQLGAGYAVASRKRNVDFHAIFKSIPEDDYLIEDYGCALQRDILVQGRLYISEQHLCFNANIFGWVTTLVIPFSDVVTVEKRMTALIIPNAIQVITTQSRHTFASFLSRDATFDLMNSIWNIARPPGSIPTHGLTLDVTMPALDDLSDGTKVAGGYSEDSSASALSHSSATPAPPSIKKIDHPPTQCDCSPDEHYKELIWDATYPTSPEKLYNILFQSDFLKDFWVNEEHLTEIEVGDWTTSPEAQYPSRSVSYIRPVNAPVGPKTIKCLVSDEHRALDFDKYVSVLSTARTPDAPAGGSFCVRTLTCITWGPNNSSRWLVTAAVEWTKVNRFLKSIIESSAISGQKAYQVGVDQALRKHIQLSQPPEPMSERVENAGGAGNSGGGVGAGLGVGGVKAKGERGRPISMAQGGRSGTVKGTPESRPSDANRTSSKIGSGSGTAVVSLFGLELSWMMLGSIGLVFLLLVWNLILSFSPPRHHHHHSSSSSTTTTSPSPVHFDDPSQQLLLPPQTQNQNSKHRQYDQQLSRDVAHTVREALHEYFRDHPILLHSSSPSPSPSSPLENPLSSFEGSTTEPSPLNEAASGDGDGRSGTGNAAEVLSPDLEIAQIELLLQSLEIRIRNVRNSLVLNPNASQPEHSSSSHTSSPGAFS